MSESNKKKTSKLFKFVVIYTITIILVTALLIFLNYKYDIDFNRIKELSFLKTQQTIDITNTVSQNDNQVSKNEYSEKIERTDILDKYYLNNLELKEEKQTYGNVVETYDGEPMYKVTVEYVQIDGLKDKKVQNKVNDIIKEKVDSLVLDEEIYDKDIKTVRISAYNNAGYLSPTGSSDLFSLCIEKDIEYNTDKDYEILYYPGINCRLDTGEELKIKDLFTKDARLNNILSQSVYKSLAYDYMFEYGNVNEIEDGNFDEINYGKIENDVYNIISKFNSQKEKVFCFSQDEIKISIDNRYYTIKTAEYSDYININNIVKSNTSLYVKGNNPKVNYAFSKPYMKDFEYIEKVSDNAFVSIYNVNKTSQVEGMYDYEPENIKEHQEYENNLRGSITEIVSAIKKDSKKENGKGYIYNISYYQDEYYDEEYYSDGFDQENYIVKPAFIGEKIEIDLENFDENVERAFSLACQNSGEMGDIVFTFSYMTYIEKYKSWDILIRDANNDGKLEFGQRLYNIDDWEAYSESKFEY